MRAADRPKYISSIRLPPRRGKLYAAAVALANKMARLAQGEVGADVKGPGGDTSGPVFAPAFAGKSGPNGRVVAVLPARRRAAGPYFDA